MTREELKTLKPGEILYDKKYGFKFELASVCPYWRGFLSQAEIERQRPDGYDLCLKPVEGQDYQGLYKFENHFTFGRGIYINSKRMKRGV